MSDEIEWVKDTNTGKEYPMARNLEDYWLYQQVFGVCAVSDDLNEILKLREQGLNKVQSVTVTV